MLRLQQSQRPQKWMQLTALALRSHGCINIRLHIGEGHFALLSHEQKEEQDDWNRNSE